MNVGSPSACGTVAGYTLGCGPGGASFGLPYPAFPYSTISNISDTGQAEYNSLQIKAETKTPKYGLYALVGYTYARAYDNGFTDGLGSSSGRHVLPSAGLAEAGLGAVADQSEPELHCQRRLQPALRQRSEVWLYRGTVPSTPFWETGNSM